ncbi:MAG: glucosamine 6-phosphate synthetase [Ignavibacteria bacterium CG_4_10_14_3_um_filter_37_18]|nr:MAG: glucosamine 6-phosphate synthetase [Ignavibacteria bacterium CG_4_10_14_3_um_filter_37_18]
MCGIFGFIAKPNTTFPIKSIEAALRKIAQLSESRGKDSAGIAFRNTNEKKLNVIKGDVPIRDLLKSKEFEFELKKSLISYQEKHGFSALGHARLVTNGSQLKEENNQPVIKDGVLLIHNGIIVNVDELWQQNTQLKREFRIDTEVIISLLRKELNNTKDFGLACSIAFKQLEGTYSIAAMFTDLNQFLLATNNGSLYYLTDDNDFIFFASERNFLEKLKKENSFNPFKKAINIKQLNANQALIIDLDNLQISHINLNHNQSQSQIQSQTLSLPFNIHKILLDNLKSKNEVVIDPSIYINRSKEHHLFSLLENNSEAISKLKRCTKCLLPETFPFIYYDHHGVCNYCNHYMPQNKVLKMETLKAMVEPYRRNDGHPDCIVPFSGGRDSTYALHIVKHELGMNPIAFTYDWGMVTDLARRNIARVCGKLGVENIIVSADINWKRENIKKNVIAWLNNPSLGMIPIFMAGDKYFYYYADKVRKQNQIKLNLFGMNNLENTDFKTGFAGVAPKFDKKYIYSLSLAQQIKLFSYIGLQYTRSPGYFNQSLLDTFGSFFARYLTSKKDYFHIFDFLHWDENLVEDILFNEYNWEKAIDTNTTWRIGDGTASFYNYIYHTVAGFSEYDTFRSNQIREGMIDRNTALSLIKEENKPRYETIRWYLEIIGLDFIDVIKKINAIPKLFKTI